MGIKTFFLAVTLLLLLFSCAVTSVKKQNRKINGKVMLENSLFPVRTNISIYQKNKKIIETQSTKEGFFQFSTKNIKLNREVTFVVEHKAYSDTIFNVNGHEYLLYKCTGNDTIVKKLEKFENDINLLIKKCTGLVSDKERVIEHN
jgi:hypothetical protein